MDSEGDIRRALVALSQGSQPPDSRAAVRTSFRLGSGPPPPPPPSSSSSQPRQAAVRPPPPAAPPTPSGEVSPESAHPDGSSVEGAAGRQGWRVTVRASAAPWVTEESLEHFTASLAALDESQREAVCFPTDIPLLVVAGAGSGKTQTMAMRIAYLLVRGVPAHNILGICFTRQAAETLRARVESVLPASLRGRSGSLKLRTLHALGLECLRRFGVVEPQTEVFDASRQRDLARRVVAEHAQLIKATEAVDSLLDYVNRVKGKKEPPIGEANPQNQDAYLYRFYQTELHDVCNAVDFGDLQHMFCATLRPVRVPDAAMSSPELPNQSATVTAVEDEEAGGNAAPLPVLVASPSCATLRREFTHIVVDEFQDLNEVQVEILALLAGDACQVTCVGDPNQCIYAWRGAMPAVFAAWRRRFPQSHMHTLAVNYRSDEEICSAANRIVGTNQRPHNVRHHRRVTLVSCASVDEERDAVPLVIEEYLRSRDQELVYEDIAILCRTRRRVAEFYELLRERRIPVRQLKGVVPDNISTVRALLALLRLCVTPHSDADVHIVLTGAPLHLSTRVAKGFFFSLSATCEERRAAGRDHGPQATSPHPLRPSEYSFFTVIRDLVFHNFSSDAFPKLDGLPKTAHKVLRGFVQVLLTTQEMLAKPSCDVEQLLRYVVAEAGFDTTPNAGVQVMVGQRGKRRRSPATGNSLAASVAAEYSTAATAPDASEHQQRHDRLRGRVVAGAETSAFYTADEEDAMLSAVQFSLAELLLEAHQRTVQAMATEEEQHSAAGALTGHSTAVMVLRRVLDQFTAILPSDDFGPLASASGDSDGGRGGGQLHGVQRARAMGRVTVGTVHKAKGMEWPAVIIPGCWVGEFPVRATSDEERRVFYVAMSRAMTDLVLITAQRGGGRQDLLEEQTQGPQLERTPYLTMIDSELEKVECAILRKAAGRV